MNIKLIVAYEGTAYFGWQKTSMGPSIEEELEKALHQILQEKVALQAASRTDRGVHAIGQVVNFHTTKPLNEFKKLLIGINALLPKDIAVVHAEEAAPGFHPTLDVKTKVYTYEICHSTVQLPQYRRISWHFHYPLDLNAMQQAAKHLIGTHDFSAFCNQKKNEAYESHVRTVKAIDIVPIEHERLKITVRGQHFLYKMVRNIAGTLAYIGAGKLKTNDLENILQHKDRTLAGMTAPAHGLTLLNISY